MPVKHYRILTRSVTIYNPDGSRVKGGKAVWGHWQNWSKYISDFENLRDAMNTCREACKLSHTGFVVYRQLMVGGRYTSDIQPYWQIKWGTDGKLYENFRNR